MRDTAKARAQRVTSNLSALTTVVLKGTGRHIEPASIADKVERMADLAAKPVRAPQHGAEWGRALVFFTEQLLGDGAAQKLAQELDSNGVIWRNVDQVRAAGKQIGRLRSDTVRAKRDDIPVDTLVYAEDPTDFVGHTYVALESVAIPVKASTGPSVKVKHGRNALTLPLASLRYVEGPMIRSR